MTYYFKVFGAQKGEILIQETFNSYLQCLWPQRLLYVIHSFIFWRALSIYCLHLNLWIWQRH